MIESKPRRTGAVKEYQNGHWFLYEIEWEETSGDSGRKHKEIEIYYAKAREVWHSTDPKKHDDAKRVFQENPEFFLATEAGKLPDEDLLKQLIGL